MILSIHIPKTAGSSFRGILAQVFGPDLLLKYWEMTDAAGKVITTIPRSVRCIHGHFVPEALLPQFPNATLITWVRDPVERIASCYAHVLRQPDWRHPMHRQVHEKGLSLLQFAGLEPMRNEIAHYLNGRRPADFRFIGLTEQFAASLRRFFKRLALAPIAAEAMQENANPDRPEARYSLDDDTRRKIAALNERDMDLYADCCRMVAERERHLARVA